MFIDPENFCLPSTAVAGVRMPQDLQRHLEYLLIRNANAGTGRGREE